MERPQPRPVVPTTARKRPLRVLPLVGLALTGGAPATARPRPSPTPSARVTPPPEAAGEKTPTPSPHRGEIVPPASETGGRHGATASGGSAGVVPPPWEDGKTGSAASPPAGLVVAPPWKAGGAFGGGPSYPSPPAAWDHPAAPRRHADGDGPGGRRGASGGDAEDRAHPAIHGERRAPEAPLFPRAGSSYTVQRGDTLWEIAAVALDTDDPRRIARYWPRIHRVNRTLIGPDPNLILPGQRLVLPAE